MSGPPSRNSGADDRDDDGPPAGRSLWLETTDDPDYPTLEGGQRADVAVVGAGIAGLTAAYELDRDGFDVTVLEADTVCSGTTGYTTAKLTSQHGLRYRDLRSTVGEDGARQYAAANEAAIDDVERRIDELGVECAFERTSAYVYAPGHSAVDADEAADRSTLREEARTASELGLPASFVDSTDLPFEVAGAVEYGDQAQFHPREYLLGLAEAVDGDGSRVFQGTRVTDVDDGDPCRVASERGEVVADDVIVASHFPVHDRGAYFARLHPKQAYLLAVRLNEPAPEGMYLSSRDPPDTVRAHPTAADELLLVGGQRHRMGEGPGASECYRRCEAFARRQFDVDEVVYRWSTHDHYPVDGRPFVGRAGPGTDSVYVATGFAGWGMTGGSAAGAILAGLVAEGSHPWAEVFDPLRVEPLAATRDLVAGAATNARHLVADRIAAVVGSGDGATADREAADGPAADGSTAGGSASDPSVTEPAAGHGTVESRGASPVGRYRDEAGRLQTVSAVCPHMGCVLEWNDAEETWDCPCHGSRFERDGTVLSGPATTDLPRKDEH